MFIVEQSQYWVNAKPEQVVYLSTSANRPIVIPPGQQPEPAQSYICILHTERGYEIYIFLHLIHSNQGLLYVWDGGAVSKDMAFKLQENAFEFTGSMGFIMTDLRWKELKPEARIELFNSVPLFFQDLSRFKEEIAEEVLEIEPSGEEELIVEPVKEELTETVTAGDFVISEETFDEPPKEERGFGDLPELSGVEIGPEGTQLTGAGNEEDVLLDQLEVREETETISSPRTPEAPSVSSKGIIMEPAEEEIKIPFVEESPPLPRPTGPGSQAQVISSSEAESEIEEVVINIPAEAPVEEAESSKEQVEEVVLSSISEPKPIQAPGRESKPGLTTKFGAGQGMGRAQIFSEKPEKEFSSTNKVERTIPSGGGLSQEELELLIRFLAMF